MAGPNSPVAAIAGAFKSYKPDIRWSTIDPQLEGRLNTLWSNYDTSQAPGAVSKYLTAYAGNQGAAQGISNQNQNFLNQYVNQQYDPTKLYGTLLGQNQAALGNFLMNPALADLTRQRKETEARLGRTGGAGIYDQLLQGRLQQQLAQQAVPNLLGYTNQAFNTAGQLGQQVFGNQMGIIGSGAQYNQLDQPSQRYLEPQRLGRANLLADLGNLGALSTQQDKNRAYYRQPGLAESVSNALEDVHQGVYNTANQALDIYKKAYGGGAMGGAGGGGGGGDVSSKNSPYGTQNSGAYNPGGYGNPGVSNSPYSGYYGQGAWGGVPSSWSQYGSDPYSNPANYYPTGM